MENLQQNVLDALAIAFDITDTSLLIQGVVIALVLGFVMSGLGQIIYYVLVALVLDLIIVPLGKLIYADGMEFGGAVEHAKTILADLMADPAAIGYRALFFVVTLMIVRLISSVIRRS